MELLFCCYNGKPCNSIERKSVVFRIKGLKFDYRTRTRTNFSLAMWFVPGRL